ncbi:MULTISPECIES: hypothetical protein [unclassified Caballeronia]|uniref:hypothetical protein n=1 Tax=unclassified Caballeronia TaxID=2646786 RepID=UPI00158B6FF1|nr:MULTISPECIES: hypothetical protein [unclassified Caballeronia]QSN61340.1 hypothetical protein JYK05_13675 [Caballeronia sp. M1242]
MATNRTKQDFARGLRLLVADVADTIQRDVPYFKQKLFRVGHPDDLVHALAHADPDASVTATTVKNWFDAKTMPRGKNRTSLAMLLGHRGTMLLDGEDITPYVSTRLEAAETVPAFQGYEHEDAFRRDIREATAAAYLVLAKLNRLDERLGDHLSGSASQPKKKP